MVKETNKGNTMNTTKRIDPKPVLNESNLYFGENGMSHCGSLRCAGMTAVYTGKTRDGAPVVKVKDSDHELFLREFGRAVTCEVCGFTGGQ